MPDSNSFGRDEGKANRGYTHRQGSRSACQVQMPRRYGCKSPMPLSLHDYIRMLRRGGARDMGRYVGEKVIPRMLGFSARREEELSSII